MIQNIFSTTTGHWTFMCEIFKWQVLYIMKEKIKAAQHGRTGVDTLNTNQFVSIYKPFHAAVAQLGRAGA